MKKYLYLTSSMICVLYTVWYMHFGKPWTNAGALSTIGLQHRALFAIWGILTYAVLAAGILLCCRQAKLNRWIFPPLLLLSAAGMALTLLFRFDYTIQPDYALHCAGSLTFSVVTGTAVFLLFLLSKQKLFAVLTAVILLADLALLLSYKETGLIEAVPILAGLIMLNIANLRRERVETARRT